MIMALKQIVLLLVLISHAKSEKSIFPIPEKPNTKPNPMPNPDPNPDPNLCQCLSKAEIIELIEDDCRDNPCKNGQCIDLVNNYRLLFV